MHAECGSMYLHQMNASDGSKLGYTNMLHPTLRITATIFDGWIHVRVCTLFNVSFAPWDKYCGTMKQAVKYMSKI